ncbi:MAG: ATP-binding cassette domain-containing protein, partial [Coriobacteriales bacterium]|nr:ATP-binding cassette domain-containing protein [Coriobacteriales bacterium]
MSTSVAIRESVTLPRAKRAVPSQEAYLLHIEGLSKSFYLHETARSIEGCQNISLTVRPGEFVGITGRSGSGKSTILRSVYRTNLPQSGAIWYHSARFGPLDLMQASNRQILYLRRFEIGSISQFLHVLPRTTAWDTVLQSALEAAGPLGVGQAEAQSETERLLRH